MKRRASKRKNWNAQLIEEIVCATDRALQAVTEPRFFRSERGFQGRFYCALQRVLDSKGLLGDHSILEMEYQKVPWRHGTKQRPDIILHVPAEESNAPRHEKNFAVWALKRRATPRSASDDFKKLDKMFNSLRYPVGVFINIAATKHFADAYKGKFADRLRTVAVWREGDRVLRKWCFPRAATK